MTIDSPFTAERAVRKLSTIQWDREQFILLELNALNEVKTTTIEFIGTHDRVVVDVGLLLKRMLVSDTRKCVIAHNHPNGAGLYPSQCDKDLTERLTKAFKLVDIDLVDHLIFNETACYSMKSEGEL